MARFVRETFTDREMKKLLYFTSDYKIGISALLTDQLLSIHKLGIDVIGVGGDNEQEPGLTNMLRGSGVRLKIINGLDEHTNYARLVERIQHIVSENAIDVIHVQNNWQLAISFAVKCRLMFRQKLEIIYTLHGFRHNSRIKSRIAQAVIGSALFVATDHVICMTEYLRKKFRLLSYKINLIPLGVKDDFFVQEYQQPPTDCLRLIFPAQFRKGKNQDMIIKAFGRYVKEATDHHSTLTLPGNGPLLEDARALAKRLGIDKQVIFPGFQSKNDIMRLYLDSNIAIVASNSETFGQSIVEPFVLGRCVLSTPVGIAPEIIKDGENGFLFNNEEQLLQIIKRINQDKTVILTSSKNNFRNRAMFRWETITKEYADSLIR